MTENTQLSPSAYSPCRIAADRPQFCDGKLYIAICADRTEILALFSLKRYSRDHELSDPPLVAAQRAPIVWAAEKCTALAVRRPARHRHLPPRSERSAKLVLPWLQASILRSL